MRGRQPCHSLDNFCLFPVPAGSSDTCVFVFDFSDSAFPPGQLCFIGGYFVHRGRVFGLLFYTAGLFFHG
jgi:hypothetical protein